MAYMHSSSFTLEGFQSRHEHSYSFSCPASCVVLREEWRNQGMSRCHISLWRAARYFCKPPGRAGDTQGAARSPSHSYTAGVRKPLESRGIHVFSLLLSPDSNDVFTSAYIYRPILIPGACRFLINISA